MVYILSRRAVYKTSTIKFIEDNTVLSQPTDNIALEGELVDLDLDLERAISPDPLNLNTKKPSSIEIGPSKLEPYESSSDKPIFVPKPIEVIAPNQPITNEPLDNSDLISKGDKIQLDYYKLLAKTSSYILSFVYKARKRVISKDSTPTTYKQVLKLPRDKQRVFYNAKTCYFIVTYIDNYLFLGPDIGYITDLKKRLNKYIEEAVSRFNLADSKPISIPLQPGLVNQLQLKEDITSHLCNSTEIKLYQSLVGTAIYIMLLTRVDISFTVQWLSRSLNRPTKSHLNAAKNLFKYLNSTKDYSICFSYNGNPVADLGPKLSNSSNITTQPSRDFYSKEGPRPLTTTSTTIVDSRNGKGSSRTSIINSSLVPIGFSNSDFIGDKATKAIREVQWIIGLFSKLYKPIDHPITLYRDNQGSITVAHNPALHARTKHTLLKFRYVREQVKAKIVTIIYLNTKCS
ncbi:hypothetical protein P8C59_008058 [Phyllachora maydis]|uniref:Reverse transcriptase Ty1/copia-type domain-containing protein n=1 Tax=Phyllachora maydis TaxID=1825666 RepID=A0AAD9IAQ8_9PEZI|nr:hypothetical protein P8C59_008058 [Phyllachora maydis]